MDQQQQTQRPRTDRQGQQVRVVDDAGKGLELSDEVVALDGRAGHLAQLPNDHQHGRTGEIADEQRLGEQIGDHAEARDPSEQAPSAHDQAERGGQCHCPIGVRSGKRCDRRAGHQGDRRLGTDRQHPRGTQRGVHDQRRQGGPQPDHRRHADQCRVGHHLRNEVGDDGDPGVHVGSQPALSIPSQHPDPRSGSGEGLEAGDGGVVASARSESPADERTRRAPAGAPMTAAWAPTLRPRRRRAPA